MLIAVVAFGGVFGYGGSGLLWFPADSMLL